MIIAGLTHSFGHSNTSVADGQSFILFVWDDVDTEIFTRVKERGVAESAVSDLVQGI